MNTHHRRWVRVCSAFFATVIVAGLAVAALAGQGPGGMSDAPSTRPSMTLAVPSTGPGAATPPPVRPDVRPTPPESEAITFTRVLPPELTEPVDAIRAYGDGEIRIEGNVDLRFSGAGTLWIDKASSMILTDLTTSATAKVDDGDMWRFENFYTGNVGLSGSNLKMRAQGKRLKVIGNGKGSLTVSGPMGTFRVTQAGRKQVSGIWTENGVTVEFETIPIAGGAVPTVRPGTLPSGLIPREPPKDVRTYQRPRLPSEHESVSTGALVATPSLADTGATSITNP
jgi:hypothetical protein